ncbi:MAG: CDP-alcohol phosphatidyltransferase family protein [Halobacteriota archaeon]
MGIDTASRVRYQRAWAALRRRIVAVAAVALLVTIGAWLVGLTYEVLDTTWLLVATTILAIELGGLYRWGPRNRRPDTGLLLARVGIPTGVTILRGLLLAWLAGFAVVQWTTPSPLVEPTAWIPVLLYGTAISLDAVDGSLARALDRETELGDKLDSEFDGIGIFVGSLVAVTAGLLPTWYLCVGVTKYVYAGVLELRDRRGHPRHDLPSRQSRRLLAGIQMAFLALALAPIPLGPLTVAAAIVLGGGYVAGFVRDYLYATGRRRS